ncbi:MAG: hypothetical protein HC874_16110 [Richelia sp. SL_2_1]|nr:hypothetical protein [Richelia sp. SL_2_1]
MRKFLATFLAVLLIFLGTAALSNATKKVKAHEQVVIEKIATMGRKKSKASKKNKAPKEYGVRMEITTSTGIGKTDVSIAIPENKPGTAVPLTLGLGVTNNTSQTFPFLNGTFIPEIVAPDGEVLKPLEPINKPSGSQRYHWLLIPPGQKRGFPLRAKLYWQNNLLKLSIPTKPHIWGSTVTDEDIWVFEALKSGTYQIRFIYETPNTEVLLSEPEINQLTELGQIYTQKLETSFVKIQLIQPTESDKNAIEVDGIRFETFLPQKVLTIPKKEPGSSGSIPLAGLSITNNTSNPIRFINDLNPEMVNADGQILFRGYFSDWLRPIEESDLVLVMPGKEITFFYEAVIWYQEEDKFELVLSIGDGGSHTFEITELGNYKIQLNYINKTAETKVYDQEIRERKSIENIWTGMVITPLKEFNLVRS